MGDNDILSLREIEKIDIFLKDVYKKTANEEEKWWKSYRQYSRGYRGWWKIHKGSTGCVTALFWYNNIHKPGGKEWRPNIIIKAILKEIRKEP